MKTNKAPFISSSLIAHYPDAKCSLAFSSPYQCLVAVLLSAQCTDEKVNKVTPELFKKYPDLCALSRAGSGDIEKIIHPLGLYQNKAKNLQNLALFLVNNFNGEVPSDYKTLVSLPGVGNKTARVVLMEAFGEPSFPVDTHVERVASRLGLAKRAKSPLEIEAVLEKTFPPDEQSKLHHCFISFGRDICHARNPECNRCFLREVCPYFLKNSSFKTGK